MDEDELDEDLTNEPEGKEKNETDKGKYKGKKDSKEGKKDSKDSPEIAKLKRENAQLQEKLRKAQETADALEEDTPKQAIATAKQLAQISKDIDHFELEAKELKIHEKDSLAEQQRKIAIVVIKNVGLTYKLPIRDESMQEHYENVIALAKEKLMKDKEADEQLSSGAKLQVKTQAMLAYEAKMKTGGIV